MPPDIVLKIINHISKDYVSAYSKVTLFIDQVLNIFWRAIILSTTLIKHKNISIKYSESESCSVVSDSRPEYWSGQPFSSPGNLPNPGIKPRSPTLRWILYQFSHKGSPRVLEQVVFPSCSGSSNPGIELGSPALQTDSLPTELSGKPRQS